MSDESYPLQKCLGCFRRDGASINITKAPFLLGSWSAPRRRWFLLYVAYNHSRPFLHSIIGLHHVFVSYRWKILLVSFMKLVTTNLTKSFYEAGTCCLSSLVRERIPLDSSPKPVPAIKAFVAVVGPCQALSYVHKHQSIYSHLIDRPSALNSWFSTEISIGIWPPDSAISRHKIIWGQHSIQFRSGVEQHKINWELYPEGI